MNLQIPELEQIKTRLDHLTQMVERMAKTTKRMTVQEYAKDRGLSESAVYKQINSGDIYKQPGVIDIERPSKRRVVLVVTG